MKTRFLIFALFCVTLALPVSALAKDNWISVRSKNFNLIGNASDKEIRGVGTKLEQFRETFRLLFGGVKFSNSIPTNVVVFKNGSSYNPFRPKLANGKPNTWIAGYFQPGQGTNYITISTEGEKEDTYGTIFHEYVHHMLDTNFGRSEVPPWFNEGLAEYYQTFQIKEDQKVTLGDIQNNHLELLQSNRMIPLREFFAIDNYSLHNNGNHSRSVFYAQAWALMHYLIQGNKGANREAMGKFLSLMMKKTDPETAFKQVFGYDYSTMEKALEKYVGQRTFIGTIATLKEKLIFDADMVTTPLSDAEANAYLGDLLYHTHEYKDAEKYLQTALALDANSTLANTAMGLVKLQQHKFPEAKSHLEKAIAAGKDNYYAYYNYAYVLSRENMDEFNYVSNYPADKAEKMRAALKRSVELNPGFSENYRMLAFISIVNSENLDEALNYVKKGLSLQPGSQEFLILLASIYTQQEKFGDARQLAQRISDTAEDDNIRSRAANVLSRIKEMERYTTANNENRKRLDEALSGNRANPVLLTRGKTIPPEEVERLQKEHANNSINKVLEQPKTGEKQAVGRFQKVACAKGEVVYTFQTESEVLTFASKDFSALKLLAMTPEAEELAFGCSVKAAHLLSVITYRPGKTPAARGELSSIAFVPAAFKLRSTEEIAKSEQAVYVYDEDEKAPVSTNTAADRDKIIAELEQKAREEAKSKQADYETERREMMMNQVRDALRKPQPDEMRMMGSVEKVECVKNKVVFHINADSKIFKFRSLTITDIKLVMMNPEYSGIQVGCGANLPPIPAVITFVPDNNAKAKENGVMVAIEFVPRTFKLD